jgi:hypothetical protein
MPESRGEHFSSRFVADVNSRLEESQRRVKELERRLDEMSKTVGVLVGWQKFDVAERSGGHRADPHLGKRALPSCVEDKR